MIFRLVLSAFVISATLKNDSAIVRGIYKQTVTIHGTDTANVRGEFNATMIPYGNRSWLISRMRTRSL
jgi:hypothetical protein